MAVVELLIARNPDPDSRLPYLVRLPLSGGLLFRTSGMWPRTSALYCYPVPLSEWPETPELVERVRVRSCARRGAAIDLVLARARENRSQIVFTKARGRDAVFWQSARTRKKARPDVRTPTARAGGVAELEIIVDSHERYAYRFPNKAVTVVRRALRCGDYGTTVDGRLVAAVERKSLADLVSSLTGGKLAYALGDLASLPRAALVVEDRYSEIFKLDHVRPATVADGLAELQVRWPTVPIVFAETRQLAEEWTYRYLAAAHTWAATEPHALARTGLPNDDLLAGPVEPEPTTAEVRLGTQLRPACARPRATATRDLGRLERLTRPRLTSSTRHALVVDGIQSGTERDAGDVDGETCRSVRFSARDLTVREVLRNNNPTGRSRTRRRDPAASAAGSGAAPDGTRTTPRALRQSTP